MTKMAGGFYSFWSSDPHIKARWSSKCALNSPQKVFLYAEYVMLGLWMKFGTKSRFWPHFPYHFYVQTVWCLWKYSSRLQKGSKTTVSLQVFFINAVFSLLFSKDWIDIFGELLRKNTHNGHVVIQYTTVYT